MPHFYSLHASRCRRLAFAVLSLSCTAGVCAGPSPALAGFGWTPPLTIESGAPPVMAAPPAAVDAADLGAVPGAEPSFPAMMPPPSMTPVMPVIDATPLQTAPVRNAPVQAAPLPAPGFSGGGYENYAVVEGFGSSVPLATVLGQILPEGYVYSFDPAVNPGVSVSWQGGKSWDRVLADALAPRGLTASIAGKTVFVTSGASPGAASPAVSAPEPLSAAGGPSSPGLLPSPSTAAPADSAALAAYYRSRGLDESGYHPSYPRRNAELRAPEAGPGGTPLPAFASPSSPPSFSGGGPGFSPGPSSAASGMAPVDMMTPMPPSAAPVPLVPAADAAFSAPSAPPPVAGQTPPVVSPASLPVPVPGSAVLDPYEIRYWQAAAGESLQAVLSRWAGGSGVRLVWSSDTNFTLPVPVRMQGTFADAVTQALAALETAGFKPAGKLYPNLPNGPSVLIVKDNAQAFTN